MLAGVFAAVGVVLGLLGRRSTWVRLVGGGVRVRVRASVGAAALWVVALILMAFGEVVVRLGTIVVRGRLLLGQAGREGAAVPRSRSGAYA